MRSNSICLQPYSKRLNWARLRVQVVTLALLLFVSANVSLADEIKQTKTVGPVSVTVTLSPDQPRIGDELTFEISVEAEPNVDLLMPEFGEALNRFAIINYVPENNISADGTTRAIQRYTLQSDTSGETAIPPILVEFVDNRPGKAPTPDDFDAFEILTDPITFEVESVVDGDLQLKPPMGKLEIPEPVTQTSWWWAGLLTVATLVCLLFAVWGMRRRGRAKQRSAYEVASWKIGKLRKDQESPSPMLSVESFFVEISDVVRQYLEQRFSVRAPDLTTDEFLQLAQAESELTRQHQKMLGEFLQQADVVKFAGVSATRDDVRRSLDLAARFVDETRGEPDNHRSAGPASQPTAGNGGPS